MVSPQVMDKFGMFTEHTEYMSSRIFCTGMGIDGQLIEVIIPAC